ncbi:MAG: SDR family oxidoreductase [Bacteroidales bacterium]|nr:SDR family oxidoreductase [Bacteroidales bacterium]
MKILVTGANGYIGKRIIPVLLENGHHVVCAVRDRRRLNLSPSIMKQVEVAEVNFLENFNDEDLPRDIDVAYFLIHSMAGSIRNFMELEKITAHNFISYTNKTTAKQIVFLSGIINDDQHLSLHLQSRLNVEKVLKQGQVPVTVLRAGIIVGSGSASFEIIRDLTEKLPVMVAPRWVNSKSQPIAIRDVISFLTGVTENDQTLGKTFDIGGPEVLTYKQMLLKYARVRKLKRFLFVVPVMTPRLSSYWLYFLTSTSYKLAVNLVDSMKINVVARDNQLQDLLGIDPLPYEKAIERALENIDQNMVVSSWKDAFIASRSSENLNEFIEVPSHGCFTDQQKVPVPHNSRQVLEKIWSLGGQNGWYYANRLWLFRGFVDKLAGGVGLRRGRTNPDTIHAGDALDFWRVLVADKEKRRLLLFAEMKLPGEAWLEFMIKSENGQDYLYQTATFRPKGIAGRLYWYSLLPFHKLIFKGMAKRIGEGK